ncbi:MAG: NAD-dependent epimerase/dehydratase family protein [Chloroflexota bacterium]
MTTLITGGAGFVGSHLAALLASQDKPVVLLDNFDPYYDVALKRARVDTLAKGLPLVEADIRDFDALDKIFEDHNITRVVNLAAMPGVRYSVGRARLYMEVNTTGAVNLMELCVKHDCEVMVQASTSSIYGQTDKIPFQEADRTDHPLAPYPASKRAAELFAYGFHNLHGLNITSLRFFNVYGPHGRPDMMPIKALQSILNGDTIHLWNGGNLKRDWTYIEDTVNGVASALERPMGFQVINLGCGDPLPLLDFITIYEELVGKEAVTVIEPAPPTEPLVTYCDNTLARELLDFDPKTKIADGLAKVWDWYRDANGIA